MVLGLAEIVVIIVVATLCLTWLIGMASCEIKSVIRTWRSYDPLTGRLFE